jgi:hypothetical protein
MHFNKIVKFENDNFIYAEIAKKGFPIFKNIDQFNLNFDSKVELIKCFLKINSNFSQVEINRLKLNQYEIFNNNKYDINIIFPFTDYKNWFNKKKK